MSRWAEFIMLSVIGVALVYALAAIFGDEPDSVAGWVAIGAVISHMVWPEGDE